MSQHKSKEKKNMPNGQGKKKINLKYPVVIALVLVGTGLIYFNTNQGKGALSAFANNDQTNQNAGLSQPIKTQKEEAPKIIPADQSQTKTAQTAPDAKAVAIPAEKAPIKIALAKLSSQAQFFTYKSQNNTNVKYFALLDAQGKPHVAFDACDVCYKAKRGYALQSGQAVCKNCGNAYPISAIGTENKTGGCWPSYLPIKVTGQEIVINSTDLEQKAFMF